MSLDSHLFLFKVYLAGVQVPFSSASVQLGTNGPARASVNVAPTAALAKIVDNTPCHIFWLDENPLTNDGPVWRLLFEGLAVGGGSDKEANTRATSLEFESVSTIWYQAFLHMFHGSSGFNYGVKADLIGAGATNLGRSVDIRQFLLQAHSNLLGKKSVVDTYKDMLKRVASINAFFGAQEKRLKLSTRVKVLEDKDVPRLLRRRAVWDKIFDAHSVSILSEYSSIMDLLGTLNGFIYYDWVDIQGPKSLSDQIVFKPANYFQVPPKCNVLFPSRSTFLSFRRQFRTEPTRLVARLYPIRRTSGSVKATTPFKLLVTPKEIQDAFDEAIGAARTGGGSKTGLDKALLRLTSEFLTEEEKIRGIIPRIINLAPAEWSTEQGAANSATGGEDTQSSGTDVASAARETYTRNLLDYKFSVARREKSSMAFSHSFNPFVVPGFPCLALDSAGHIYAYVSGLTHTFTTRGGGTQIQLGYIRRLGDQFAFPPIPSWINEPYVTGGAYNSILGVGPVLAGSREGNRDSYTAAADALFEQAVTAEDPREFAYSYIQRPIVTEQEWAAAVGATGSPGPDGDVQVYSGGPFTAVEQAPIKEHVAILAKNDALLGY